MIVNAFCIHSVRVRLSDNPEFSDGHLDLFQDLRHPLLGPHLGRVKNGTRLKTFNHQYWYYTIMGSSSYIGGQPEG